MTLLTCLQQVKSNAFWVETMLESLKNPTPEVVDEIVKQLNDQARDNGPLLKKILGDECFSKLINNELC